MKLNLKVYKDIFWFLKYCNFNLTEKLQAIKCTFMLENLKLVEEWSHIEPPTHSLYSYNSNDFQ